MRVEQRSRHSLTATLALACPSGTADLQAKVRYTHVGLSLMCRSFFYNQVLHAWGGTSCSPLPVSHDSVPACLR